MVTSRERAAWFPVWRGMLEATGHGGAAATSGEVWFGPEMAWRMTLDDTNPASVLSNVRATRNNLRQSRDIFSPETWGVLSRLDEQLGELVVRAERPDGSRPEASAQAIAMALDTSRRCPVPRDDDVEGEGAPIDGTGEPFQCGDGETRGASHQSEPGEGMPWGQRPRLA